MRFLYGIKRHDYCTMQMLGKVVGTKDAISIVINIRLRFSGLVRCVTLKEADGLSMLPQL